jgi:hypothetical protein
MQNPALWRILTSKTRKEEYLLQRSSSGSSLKLEQKFGG